MNWWKKLRRRRRLERDLTDEISFHLEMRARDTNAPPFGNETLIREAAREFSTFHWIETTWRDLAYAVRGFRKSPGFTFTAIASLALGIGAVIAIFTAADDLLFRPLPYPDPDRLMMVWESNRTRPASARRDFTGKFSRLEGAE
jgi:macrolide transport system ATP-binding/permease protein